MRILALSETWQGSTDYGYVRAFRRLGHSVQVVSTPDFIGSGWRGKPLRALRRLLLPALIREYNDEILRVATYGRPDLLFVFKGAYVSANTLSRIRDLGVVAVNVYPDTTFRCDDGMLARAMSQYDWVFQTKSFGVADVGTVNPNVSFMEHGFDPEVHCPVMLSGRDREQYGCQTSFVGTWSCKKEALLAGLRQRMPELKLRIRGEQWEKCRTDFNGWLVRSPVYGLEYSKAIAAAQINLAPMVEARPGAPRGDLTSTRTFEIPAVGGFILHERNDEVATFFEEGRECAMFDGPDELAEKIRYYLDHPQERAAIAAAGYLRALSSGYSTEDHARKVLAKYQQIIAGRDNA